MVGTRWRPWYSILALLLMCASCHIARASSLPAGFSDASVRRPDGTVDQAAGIVSASDGRIFVWERAGRVWIIGGASAQGAPLIDVSDEVSTIGSLGLSGFALDPRFPQNGYIYLSMRSTAASRKLRLARDRSADLRRATAGSMLRAVRASAGWCASSSCGSWRIDFLTPPA